MNQIEPIHVSDLSKGIQIPREIFDATLEALDWTWHQVARGEFPAPFTALDDFQLAIICEDPFLWCQSFLREPEDADHKDPYSFFDYQVDSIRDPGSTIHKCGAETGKTREICAWMMWKMYTVPGGSGLVGAPQQTHLDEIIESVVDQLHYNPDLEKALVRWKKHPHHAFYMKNGFKVDFRPSGHDGEAYRGVHVRTFAIKDEAAKDKNKRQWSEFWRALKPECIAKIYSVPDGDRSCEFFKLAERAGIVKIGETNKAEVRRLKQEPEARSQEPERIKSPLAPLCESGEEAQDIVIAEASDNTTSCGDGVISPLEKGDKGGFDKEDPAEGFSADEEKILKNLQFTLYKWPKTLMPNPFWSDERRKFYVDQYGGEDAPEYQHNILGEDGDPENTVFPWHQLKLCIKEVPEYRALKILVDSSNAEVIIKGYRCQILGDAQNPIPKTVFLMDTVAQLAGFFDRDPTSSPDDPGESEFTRLIKSFFISVPGAKRGGADLGFSNDPTEIIIKNILGKKERMVARLQLKHVTYDQQCQAVNALDDVYGPAESIVWGTDFGNAGSAVGHDLQGLDIYKEKDFLGRLRGFMFESATDNINEDGAPVIDAKTGKPARTTLKELSTDILVKKMQQQNLEYPPDPDIVLYYTNHTVRFGGKHRIFKKEDDHLVDADRVQMLAKLLAEAVEDLFA